MWCMGMLTGEQQQVSQHGCESACTFSERPQQIQFPLRLNSPLVLCPGVEALVVCHDQRHRIGCEPVAGEGAGEGH